MAIWLTLRIYVKHSITRFSECPTAPRIERSMGWTRCSWQKIWRSFFGSQDFNTQQQKMISSLLMEYNCSWWFLFHLYEVGNESIERTNIHDFSAFKTFRISKLTCDLGHKIYKVQFWSVVVACIWPRDGSLLKSSIDVAFGYSLRMVSASVELADFVLAILTALSSLCMPLISASRVSLSS